MSEDSKVTSQWIRLTEGEGPEAYLALPKDGATQGAVVVAGEMFGVNDQVRGICDRLAAAGYAAVAPDFYWRTVRRPQLPYGGDGRERGLELMRGLRREEVLEDLAAARTAAERHAGGGGTGILGFSLGGHIAVLGATDLRFDLVVSYYGGWLLDGGIPLAEPVPPVGQSAAIAANTAFVLGFFGADDYVMSLDEWERVGEHFRAAGVVHDQVTYPGVGHGFFNEQRPETYHPEASKDSWKRTLDALGRFVRRGGSRKPA